jgi:hypothetical protein
VFLVVVELYHIARYLLNVVEVGISSVVNIVVLLITFAMFFEILSKVQNSIVIKNHDRRIMHL